MPEGLVPYAYSSCSSAYVPVSSSLVEMEKDMTNKTGLVELIQTELKTFRASATVQGEPDFRELAVSLVRVFRDFVGNEIKMLDAYDKNDKEQPGKGQGWE